MRSHRSSLHVQVISTACVFKLTTQDLAEAMPLSLLGTAVAQLLYAMKTFPNHQQVSHRRCFCLAPILPPSGSFRTLNPRASLFCLLPFQVQMNCLLALCSEYILQEVPFDK